MTISLTIKNKKEQSLEQKMNAVRAGVLGSNDGILTVVGVLFSTAAATTDNFIILIAGFADLLACAFSMAAGEYASVSAQRETEKAVVDNEQENIHENKNYSHDIIMAGYIKRGVSEKTASRIADELTAKREIAAVVYEKYTLKIGEYVNPWDAAISSLFSAGLGGIFPLAAMFFLPSGVKFIGTILATTLAVALTGSVSAVLGKSDLKAAVIRNIIIGLITVAIHYYVGRLF